jgi:uncharacterized membrane protein
MRKTMEVVGLGMLAVLYWITYSALNGAEKLPDRIPTHFNISGQPNAWGPPGFLWFLPVVAIGLYLLMTVLGSIQFRRYNLPVPVTESNLPFIQEQTGVMVAWIKCELLCLFTYLQWSIIQSARTSEFRLSPLLIPVFLAVIFSTVGWHLTAIIRGAKARAESPDPVNYMKNH